MEDYIIVIIYKNKKNLQILSKMNLNQYSKINNERFNDINLSNEKDFYFVLKELKIIYEDYWKKINQINTSIKLPLTISINAKHYNKIKVFEDTLIKLDLVDSYEILKFDNQNIYIKIIYNGVPNKFINDLSDENIIINNDKSIWTIK